MTLSRRPAYILCVTAAYLAFSLAWIFLSDRVLLAFVDPHALVAASTAKGVLFVLLTTAGLYTALRAVPHVDAGRLALEVAALPRWVRVLGGAALALALCGATLVASHFLASTVGGADMLLLFTLPIAVCALLGGLWPGLLATLFSYLGAGWLAGSWWPGPAADRYDALQWLLLVLDGLVVSLISEALRRARRRQDEHRQLLDAVVSGTSDAVFVKDLQGRYLMINEAAAAFVGRRVDELLGQDDRQLFDAASAQAVREADAQVMQRGGLSTHEERLTSLDGQQRVYLVTKGPVHDSEGRVRGLFGVSRDVTQYDRIQADLQASEARLREREQQLARVLEGSDQGYWDWDLRSGAFSVSARWETMLGYAPGEVDVRPEHWDALVPPEDLALARESIERHLRGETPMHELELQVRTRDGGLRWILTRGRIVERAPDGTPLRMAGTHTDIAERKLLERTQREAGAVFEHSFEGIMVVGVDGLIARVNPAFSRITGYTEAEVLGQPPRMLSSGQHAPSFYQALWESVNRQGFWRGEIWNRRKSGEVFAELLSISVVRDAQGALQHYLGVFTDISQLKAHAAELDRVAHHDTLTGLPNRRLLGDRLAQAIARASHSGRSSAVCYLDLDGFKAVNDRLGHAVGDQLLLAVAQSLKAELRPEDTLARPGGDEFVLILTEVDSPEECTLLLDRLLAAVGQAHYLGGERLSLSASIGVSLFPADDADADTLLRHADQAMVLAKEAGKNRYQLFDPEADRLAQAHRQQLALLQGALARDEFVLHYQPKVDLVSGELVGVEALIRWQHPERGLVMPADFLPLVHGSGLEQPFGEWVIEAALRQAEAWRRAGEPIKVSVNIGGAHLLSPDFQPRLRAALARHPALPPGVLELEVLETAAISDMPQAIEAMRACRELGVGFALDDFGTGYSSLTYLRQLPVDLLKIDQSFVRNMLTDADDRGIVQGVVQLAGVFQREVIAEGVETLEHGAVLRRMGCHLAQGYGIARPMPAAALPAWMAGWRERQAWRSLEG